MRRETAGVTESLLQAAKEEFLTYGFHDADIGGMRSQYQFHIYPVWRQERTFHRNRTGSGRWSDGDVYAEHTEGNRVSGHGSCH